MLDFRANPKDYAGNALSIPASMSGCACADQTKSAVYTADVTLPLTAVTVKFKGEDLLINLDSPATTTEEVYEKLGAALTKSQLDGGGGINDFQTGKRGLDVTGDGAPATLTVRGYVEFVSAVANGATVNFVMQ